MSTEKKCKIAIKNFSLRICSQLEVCNCVNTIDYKESGKEMYNYGQGAKINSCKKRIFFFLQETSVMRDNTDWVVCLCGRSLDSNDQEHSKKFAKWDLF